MLATKEHPKYASMHKTSQFSNYANVFFLRVLNKICCVEFVDNLWKDSEAGGPGSK